MGKKIERTPEVLTRGTKKLIANAIEKTGEYNRSVLCESICAELCDKFSGDSLEYQLERMNLNTTSDINRAIDTYMYKHVKLNKKSSKKESSEE